MSLLLTLVTSLIQDACAGPDMGNSLPQCNVENRDGLIPGSELTPHLSEDSWARGICKVITKNGDGKVAMYGTGFLFEVDHPHGPIRGFLTCHHVVTTDFLHLASPGQIFLEFQAIQQTYTLNKIQNESNDPIFSHENDFYFALLSDEFSNEITKKYGAQFIQAGEAISNEMIIIPQHPDGKERYIATAPIDPSWDAANMMNVHQVSTKLGSSGAPLLQRSADEVHVIGINRGYDQYLKRNMAVTISAIIKEIKRNI